MASEISLIELSETTCTGKEQTDKNLDTLQRLIPTGCQAEKMHMKKLLLVCSLSLSIFFVCSCKKDSKSGSLEGRWELGAIDVWQEPARVLDLARSNGNRVEFSAGSYKFFENGVPVKTGTYLIMDDSIAGSQCYRIPAYQLTHRIVYDGDFDTKKNFIHFSGNAMVLHLACDTTLEYYR